MEYEYEYDEEVEQMIKELEEKFPPRMKEGGKFEEMAKRLRLAGRDPGTIHLRAAPVFEVSSVTIHSTNRLVTDGKPCEIYGVIAAYDEDDNTYVLYNRRQQDAERLFLGDPISLDEWPISPSKPIEIGVYLRERIRGVQIASGTFNLAYKNKEDYDTCKVEHIQGECGFATFKHITLQSALMAKVFVKLTKRKDDGKDYVDIRGSISGLLGNKSDQLSEGYFLFKRDNERVVSRDHIRLSRSVVAVPAHSSVWIVLDLWECDTACKIVQTMVDFAAAERGRNTRVVKVEQYHITVEVKWRHPDELFLRNINQLEAYETEGTQECESEEHAITDLYSSLDLSLTSTQKNVDSTTVKHMPRRKPVDWSLSSSTIGNEHSGDQQHKERSLLLAYPLASTDLSISGSAISKIPEYPIICPVVEVFSVLVDAQKDDGLGIHGMVRVHDKMGTSFIFKKDDKHPESLSQKCKVLPTVGPTRSFICEDFRLDVKLWDVDGRVLSKGYMKWDTGNVDGYISWYGRRIRSIIQGEHGYAAVHYTIFPSGARAMLKVLFFTKSEVDSRVCGSIVAQYSNVDYSTYYDIEYFQSVLFSDPLEKPVHISCGSEVPLSKCVVSAPLDCSLIVKIDLFILPDAGSNHGVINLQGTAEFRPFCNDFQRIDAESGGSYILVYADWAAVDGRLKAEAASVA